MEFASVEEKLKAFNEYIDDYKAKSTEEKQATAILELKEMLSLLRKLLNDSNIKYDFDVDKTLLEVGKNKQIEVIYTYITLIKDAFATYVLAKEKDLN